MLALTVALQSPMMRGEPSLFLTTTGVTHIENRRASNAPCAFKLLKLLVNSVSQCEEHLPTFLEAGRSIWGQCHMNHSARASFQQFSENFMVLDKDEAQRTGRSHFIQAFECNVQL